MFHRCGVADFYKLFYVIGFVYWPGKDYKNPQHYNGGVILRKLCSFQQLLIGHMEYI